MIRSLTYHNASNADFHSSDPVATQPNI